VTTTFPKRGSNPDNRFQPFCLEQPQQQSKSHIKTIGPFILVLILSLVLVSITFPPRTPVSQPEEIPPGVFEITAIIQTADGGFALTGGLKTHYHFSRCFCESQAYEGKDMWLLKTDANGVMTWNQSYGGPDADVVCALAQTVDDGFVLAGSTESFGAGGRDMWLVKTDANGNEQWSRTFGGTEGDEAKSVIETVDGGFALVGYTKSFGAGDWDMWLVKTDANGNEQWNRTFGGREYDKATSVIETVDGGFLIAGDNFGRDDMLLLKTDANGNEQWNRVFGGTGWDEAQSVIKTADGGFALAGSTKSFGAGGRDMWLVKTDANGYEQWNRTFGGSGGDVANSVIKTADGGFALAGYTESFGAGRHDMWLVKTDANGVFQWSQPYGGGSSEGASVLIQTTDGGFALVGWTESLRNGDTNMWLVKTDANGMILWDQIYRDPEWVEVTATITPTPGWGPISLLVAAVVLTTWSKRHKKLE
jgi:hypothetical protein